MSRRVLDVGNCVPDHAAIRQLLERQLGAEVEQAHDGEQALAQLREASFDLVLINRKLDRDHSDGLDVLQQIKADRQLADLPVMLITNYEDHQQRSVSLGGEPGFGKLALHSPETQAKLAKYLRD